MHIRNDDVFDGWNAMGFCRFQCKLAYARAMRNLAGAFGLKEVAAGLPGVSKIPVGPGSYVLVLRLADAVWLTVGKLGVFEFQPGRYLYCGSALGGLRARVGRHLRADKKAHWHIDYLNSSVAGASVEAVWWLEGRSKRECEWATAFGALPGASWPVAGFGSSDCRCDSHLVYLGGQDG